MTNNNTNDAPWSVTRLANACVILEVGGARFMTDPYFTQESPYFSEASPIPATEVGPLDAIIGCHWVPDHWEAEGLQDYPHKDTPVYVCDPSMAQIAVDAGYTNVEELQWGERRQITDSVELESVIEHTGIDFRNGNPVRSANYAINSDGARVFFGGELLDLDAFGAYAKDNPAFDAAIGPMNGTAHSGRPLVVTSEQMLEATHMMSAPVLVAIHDAHIPAPQHNLEVLSSVRDLDDKDLGGVELIELAPGETYVGAQK